METTLNPTLQTTAKTLLRPFEPARDLNAVADLVELCFASTMDADGYRYLRQMRSAARNPNLARLTGRLGDSLAFPMSGFVWEEDGRLVGNLSLIPFSQKGKRIHLIANVAVHPDSRRRGIARALTISALAHLRRSGAEMPWLQVREDNPAAYHLYESLGFVETFRRTTWHTEHRQTNPVPPPHGFQIAPLRSAHRQEMIRWLELVYPSEIEWHLPFDLRDLRPDLFGFIVRLLNGRFVRQWAALQNGKFVGSITWQATQGHYNLLWLGVNPELEDAAAHTLLAHVIHSYGLRGQLALEYPDRRALQALQACGFTPHQTLIWMRATNWG
jgi:GNAT superfamily N-acetyltransferase